LIREELKPLFDLQKCGDGSSLPFAQMFSDNVQINNETFTGFGLSYLSISWEFRDIALFFHPGRNTSTETANTILKRLTDELQLSNEYLAMTISDTASAARKVGKVATGDDSNLCFFHLLGLVIGHIAGTKFHEEDGERIYFEEGRQITQSAIALSTYFIKLKDTETLKKIMIVKGIDVRNRAKLPTEVRPSSVLGLLRQLVKLQPVYEAYVISKARKKEFEGLTKIYDSVNWSSVLEMEALISPLNSWIIMCQTKKRPLLSWNSLIPEFLRAQFLQESIVEKIDLEAYCASLEGTATQEIIFPRIKVQIKDLSEVGKKLVQKIIQLCTQYLSLEHQGRSNLLPALFLDPMAAKLMGVLNKDIFSEAREMIRTIAVELAPSNMNFEGGISLKNENGKQIIVLEEDFSSSSSSSPASGGSIQEYADQEIDKYLKAPLPTNWKRKIELSTDGGIEICDSSNPVQFWRAMGDSFPYLSRSARFFLCGSSSNATQERYFSSINRIRGDLRSSLTNDKFEALATLQMNWQLYDQLKKNRVSSVKQEVEEEIEDGEDFEADVANEMIEDNQVDDDDEF
jgi:hypothetical protein